MKFKAFLAAATATFAVQAQAQALVIVNETNLELPATVEQAVAAEIAKNCPAALAQSPLKVVSAEKKTVKVDQGIRDDYYSLVIEIPNSTNDDDEDSFEIVVVDPMISNPAVAGVAIVSYEAFGWTCK